MSQEVLPDARRRSSPLGCLLKALGILLGLVAVIALVLTWTYGVDSHHADRDSIWWPERGRGLIPPTATDITLRRDLLDHYAIYTVSESDLNAFLDERFAEGGEPLDSFSTRSPVHPAEVGREVGRLGWVVTASTVTYGFSASNGGGHTYYHDPKTGSTYQSSAYW